jgi:N6-adenosine-specific RNA methylase IME4
MIDLPENSYDFIMADPPWRFAVRSEKGITSKGAEGQYNCLSIDDIAALPVARLAKKHRLLWLWATNPMIDQQIEILKGWGFKFKTLGFWNKITKNGKPAFGTGYIFRCSSEPVLIGTIGNPKTSRSIPLWDAWGNEATKFDGGGA